MSGNMIETQEILDIHFYFFVVGEEDKALNLRIQKIQEKNAEILRRKMEVEQDKEKYG